MKIAVTGFKGGVGKTTTSKHLAYYLSERGSTLLLDADERRFATRWAARGKEPLPFKVAPVAAAAALSGMYDHVVMDIGQLPKEDDLAALNQYYDLVILPTTPSADDVDGLAQTIAVLQQMNSVKFRVLLTRVESHNAKQVADLRADLAHVGAPVFVHQIPELKAFQKAADAGVLVDRANDDNAARAWVAYQAVGAEMLP